MQKLATVAIALAVAATGGAAAGGAGARDHGGAGARADASAVAGPAPGRPGAVGRASPIHAAGPSGYVAPIAPLRVVRAFDVGTTPYGPGHRGVDLQAGSAAGAGVRAAGAGSIAFAGPVAGRGVVVVRHPDGIRTEYEPVHSTVRVGQRVVAGEVIGRVAGSHRGCPVAACLHWGARRGAVYLDPLSLLAALGPVRLLPWPSRVGATR